MTYGRRSTCMAGCLSVSEGPGCLSLYSLLVVTDCEKEIADSWREKTCLEDHDALNRMARE